MRIGTRCQPLWGSLTVMPLRRHESLPRPIAPAFDQTYTYSVPVPNARMSEHPRIPTLFLRSPSFSEPFNQPIHQTTLPLTKCQFTIFSRKTTQAPHAHQSKNKASRVHRPLHKYSTKPRRREQAFHKTISDNDFVIVNFFATQDEECKTLAPIFVEYDYDPPPTSSSIID